MILDTNVVSEPLQARPNARVMQWLDLLDPTSCYITVMTIAELIAGAQRLPPGRKRDGLERSLDIIINRTFEGRILPFDLDAARKWGILTERLRRAGLNGMQQDVMIAAIALSTGNRVATRDTRPFAAAGIDVVNPWSDEAAAQK